MLCNFRSLLGISFLKAYTCINLIFHQLKYPTTDLGNMLRPYFREIYEITSNVHILEFFLFYLKSTMISNEIKCLKLSLSIFHKYLGN